MSVEDGRRLYADRSKPTEPPGPALTRGALVYLASRGDAKARAELKAMGDTIMEGEPA